MDNKDKIVPKEELSLVLQELKENPFEKFNLAFSLMSIIPFLVFFYLLISRFFSFEILLGDVGIILFIALFIAILGFYIGYSIIRNILRKIIFYAAAAKYSDELKSSFVATVSHELKNPLSIIKTSISTLLGGIIGAVNKDQRTILEICRDVSERMNRLVIDLLDLYKIEAGMISLQREFFSITKLLETQIKVFEILLKNKGMKLVKEIPKEDLSIWGDDDKIIQVVNNLISNAIKYSTKGATVSIKLKPTEGFVRLEVADTGSGIPPDKINKIFTKFERLDSSIEGTGLGLAITKDIVELHQGKIWVESQLGKGSNFIVVLPLDLRKNSAKESKK
ncbi:MAG: HAMP domain-containing sensor histidine kinase [Candidatus Omnitrophica bacterium]|nr:HAMP domain-containing sensor histidine kinase [Candidatus Omnitrophota bacterium]MDD5238331.1 HAMP domain-containing sensor histidine kinase [Candidatus Omnitrophota bacterium]